MHLPDDLDEYLRGDSALSRQYRQESAPMPPHALDRRVQKFSRDTNDSRSVSESTPCLAPLAFAASVLISVALVLAIVFGPQAAKRPNDAPRLVRVAAHADVPADAPLNRKLQLYSSDPQLVRTPSSWLADIAALRRAGRYREADVEYRRFRSAYPGYSTGEFTLQP